MMAAARIADGAVVEVLHPALQRFAQRADAAGGVEGLVGDAIEGELFALLEWRRVDEFTVGDLLAGFAVFVDDAVRTPGEIVIQGIGGVLRQGADAQPHVLQRIEAFRQVVADNGDESRRQPALRNERRLRGRGQCAHAPGVGDVLGEIEVVHAGHGRGLGNPPGHLEGRGAQDRKTAAQRRRHRVRVVDVDRDALHGRGHPQSLELVDRFVDDGDLVIAAGAQQIGNHVPDLSGADDGDAMHVVPLEA
jgi:hypothetical protein